MLIVGFLKLGTSDSPLDEFPITASTFFITEKYLIRPKLPNDLEFLFFQQIFSSF